MGECVNVHVELSKEKTKQERKRTNSLVFKDMHMRNSFLFFSNEKIFSSLSGSNRLIRLVLSVRFCCTRFSNAQTRSCLAAHEIGDLNEMKGSHRPMMGLGDDDKANKWQMIKHQH